MSGHLEQRFPPRCHFFQPAMAQGAELYRCDGSDWKREGKISHREVECWFGQEKEMWCSEEKARCCQSTRVEKSSWMQCEVITVLLCDVSRPRYKCSQSRGKLIRKVLRWLSTITNIVSVLTAFPFALAVLLMALLQKGVSFSSLRSSICEDNRANKGKGNAEARREQF